MQLGHTRSDTSLFEVGELRSNSFSWDWTLYWLSHIKWKDVFIWPLIFEDSGFNISFPKRGSEECWMIHIHIIISVPIFLDSFCFSICALLAARCSFLSLPMLSSFDIRRYCKSVRLTFGTARRAEKNSQNMRFTHSLSSRPSCCSSIGVSSRLH